ncbi:MAG: hypothetical protein Q8M08_11850 [Bacteroidales bacterium]|nr:hypothetical protein [Bacteroidales bacterium]
MKYGQGYYHMLLYLVIYFFFNGFLLPEGLLYTTILSPVLLYFLYKYRKSAPAPAWIVLLLIPIPFHWIQGVDPRTYLVSSGLVFTAAIFFFATILLLRRFHGDIPDLFKTVLIINAVFTGLALLILPIAPVRDWLWYTVPVSAGIEVWPRLKLFTYEPSYYSLIMVPMFIYFLFKVMFNREKHPMLIVLACIVPLILSLSFGVIGAILIAFFMTLVFYWKSLPVMFHRLFLFGGLITLILLAGMMLTWSGNPIAVRLENILQGKDTSAMGRLVYSFMFAKELILQHNWLFGVGPGQIKILAHDLIVNHYQYHGVVAETVRIPNAMAELLGAYGLYGFLAKLFLEIFFFVKRKVYTNVFAFTLFIFLFIYQFTGSFIVNVAELGGWAVIFSTRFHEFELLGGWRKKEGIT